MKNVTLDVVERRQGNKVPFKLCFLPLFFRAIGFCLFTTAPAQCSASIGSAHTPLAFSSRTKSSRSGAIRLPLIQLHGHVTKCLYITSNKEQWLCTTWSPSTPLRDLFNRYWASDWGSGETEQDRWCLIGRSEGLTTDCWDCWDYRDSHDITAISRVSKGWCQKRENTQLATTYLVVVRGLGSAGGKPVGDQKINSTATQITTAYNQELQNVICKNIMCNLDMLFFLVTQNRQDNVRKWPIRFRITEFHKDSKAVEFWHEVRLHGPSAT